MCGLGVTHAGPPSATALQNAKRLKDARGLILTDLLIIPIQRIPRYVMLLQVRLPSPSLFPLSCPSHRRRALHSHVPVLS